MTKALIGGSGFVGGTLRKQAAFDEVFRSIDIASIRGRAYEQIVCAGAPAQKWLANKAPDEDAAKIGNLIENLRSVRAAHFILISTVDVFVQPVGVDESSPVVEKELHPYGRHRRMLEHFVEQQFPRHTIVRLPGLVGPGLRKNVIFDLHNDNNLSAVDSRAVYQFYPMVNLAADIGLAVKRDLRLVHLTAEPVSVAEVADAGFGRSFKNELARPVVAYDFGSRHAADFGGRGRYQYGKRECMLAIRAYAQSEPHSTEKRSG